MEHDMVYKNNDKAGTKKFQIIKFNTEAKKNI